MAAKPRIRYALLDAQRGLAAIGVVLYHIPARLPAQILIPHGYLAVDFFFILSGFVVSYAYSDRMYNLSLVQFFNLRCKRFLPMSVLSVLIGTTYLIVHWHVLPSASDNMTNLLAASGLNIFLVPKFWIANTTGREMYPANAVLWTLFLELAINMIWAAWFVRRRNRVLFITCILGGLVLAFSAAHHGSADVGVSWDTVIGGWGRVTFGFFAGALLWRLRPKSLITPAGGWISCAALIGMLCLPSCPWWADVMVIAFVLPPMVYLAVGAASQQEPAVFRLLGDISYPLYAIHMPILIIVSGFLKWKYPGMHVGLSVYFIGIPFVGLAFLLGRFYDIPARVWLAKPRQQPARFANSLKSDSADSICEIGDAA